MNVHPLGRYSRSETYGGSIPLVPVEALGIRVRDKDGRWFIDCVSGAGSASLGWGNEVVNLAIRTVLDSGAPLQTLDFHSPLAEAFTSELLDSMPGQLRDGVVHLCSPSGAAAVEAALALAEIATGASQHVGIAGGFHGCTRAARSLSTSRGTRRHRYVVDKGVHSLPFPDPYRCPFGVGGAEGIRLAVNSARHLLGKRGPASQGFASLIVECVQGEGGSLPGPVEWLRALRAFSETSKIPLIADEIQTGMCRTGKMWAFERASIVPDIVVVSKGLGGGVPIAAIVMKEELNVWGPGAMTGTFRGNSMGFAAATAVLRYAQSSNLAERVTRAGHRLSLGLEEISRAHRLVGNVQGSGLMLGIDIVEPESDPDGCGARPPSPVLARALQQACYRRGIIVDLAGRLDNVIRLLPPLVIEDDDIEDVIGIVSLALQDVSAGRTDAMPIG